MVNVYCTQTVVMLTAHHWLQGSTRTVRIHWSVKQRSLKRAVRNLGSWFLGWTIVRVQYAYK